MPTPKRSWDSIASSAGSGTTFLRDDYSWSSPPGNPIPGGSNTQIQYNDSNVFAGDGNLTWDKTNKILQLGAGNTTSITSAALTGNRVFTTPDADSNPVRPLGSATAGQAVGWIGADGVQHLVPVVGVTVLDKVTTPITITNSVAETAIYSFSVPGGTLGTNSAIRLTLDSAMRNASGGALDFRLKVKYGATTLFDDNTNGIILHDGSASIDRSAPINLVLRGDGTTSSQRLAGTIAVASNGNAPNSGYGTIHWTPSLFAPPFGGTSAEDSTAAKTLSVTITLGSALATLQWKAFGALLEAIP